MGIPVTDELRALRARAYGPAADIHLDPAAMRRLEELEEAGRRSPAVAERTDPPAPADTDDAIDDDSDDSDDTDDDAQMDAAREGPAPSLAVPAPSAWRRRGVRRGLWVVSVVVAAAVGGGLAYSVAEITPVPSSAGIRQSATLEPTNGVEVPVGFFGRSEDTPIFEYEGLTLFVQTVDYGPEARVDPFPCLAVAPTSLIPSAREFDPDTDQGIDGPIYSGCETGAFPATVTFGLDDFSPGALPGIRDGRALQFVLEGDRVGVFLDRG